MDQHTILENLTQHGYAGIDPPTKVRHLVDGIKTDKLDSVKTAIMASAALRIDFDSCVNLFKDFIKQTGASNVKEVIIAAFKMAAAIEMTANHNQICRYKTDTITRRSMMP